MLLSLMTSGSHGIFTGLTQNSFSRSYGPPPWLGSTFEHGEELSQALTPKPAQAGVLSWKYIYEQRLAANVLSAETPPHEPELELLNERTLFLDEYCSPTSFVFMPPLHCVTWLHLR